MLDRDLRYPSIDGLRAFEASARLASFERAAEELNITASAISKRVGTLEDLLGAPLLTRGQRALTLTSTGKEYLEQVVAALRLFAAMPLHHRAAQRSQRLRLTVPPTFARQILVPQLESYTSAHPEIELEVLLSIPYLDTGSVDSDVEVRNGTLGALGGTQLMHDVVVPVASPLLLARHAPLQTPGDLARVPLLRTPLEPWSPWFRAAGLDWDEPTQGAKFVDLGLTLEAAVSGQGVALARPSLAYNWLASGVLVPVFHLTSIPANQYQLMPHAADGPAQELAVWLQAVCTRSAQESLAWLSAAA